ncbi:TPA: PKD domain-containing protein [Thermoplasmata archaeon]|nr:PKD domain-containing protein [Thermoplasmata archaeon]
MSEDGDLKPSSITWIADPDPAIQGQPVEMVASAADGNEDALTITIDFGDGQSYTEVTDGGTTGPQSVQVVHTYDDIGTFDVTVYADDGTFNQTKLFEMEVVEPPANSPPFMQLNLAYSAMYNETFTITPVTVSDPDDDTLTVWYDWGDGSPMSEGDADNNFAASHEYHAAESFTLTAYADDNTGLEGHNVSKTATVTVGKNLRPTIVSFTRSPSSNYTAGVEVDFTVVVNDPEGDPMVVKIIYGDTQTVSQQSVSSPGPGQNATVTLTHTYEDDGEFEVRVWVEDDKDHVNPLWNDRTATLVIAPVPHDDDGGGSNTLLIVGGALLAIIVIAAVAMMLKKRKGKPEGMDTGVGSGMEGMQPPVEPDEPPPAN